MKIVFYIPTYWARSSLEGHQEVDLVFDHPTPLDTDGTLERTLHSFEILRDPDWEIVLGIATTHPTLAGAARERVAKIVSRLSPSLQKKIRLFGAPEQIGLQALFREHAPGSDQKLLALEGYPGIRNLGFLAGTILDADVMVMVDDDQVFEDPDFVGKVREGAEARPDGEEILGWSGFCPEANQSYIRVRKFEPWMEHWNKIALQNEAYEKIIGVPEPRWKVTPLGFGGCLLAKQPLFTRLPFDPYVGRGEDMDYVMNARMFGVKFYLDNKLAMTHLPPPRTHSQWRRVREDMVRFLYQREKIRRQKANPGMVRISPEDLMPYPGYFLREDLDQKIEAANSGLAAWYEEKEENESAREALKNIEIARTMSFNESPFEVLVRVQRDWERLIAVLKNKKDKVVTIINPS